MTEQTADTFELSPHQERLWLTEPDGPSGRVQATISLTGPLDQAELQAAVRRLADRHEILRTTFAHQPGILVPLQAVAEELAPAWSTADLSDLDPGAQAQRFRELADEELAVPLDFGSGPLTRALLVKLADTSHVLLLTFSGLCADPSCAALAARELMHHYGEAGVLVEDPLQYADFSSWLRELQDGDDAEAERARGFWKETSGAVGPAIPLANTAGGLGDADGPGEVQLALEEAVVAGLRQAGEHYGAGLSSVAHAAWHVVLGRSAGEDQVTVGFSGAKRRHADLDGAFGAFSRQVPIRSRVSGAGTFAELLAEVDHAAQQASVLQDYAPPGAPNLPVAFIAVENYGATADELHCSLERIVVTEPGLAVWLTCIAGQDDLALRLHYDPALVSPENAQRLARRVQRMLASIAAETETAVDALELLDADERRLLQVEFGRGGEPSGGPAVHEHFAAQAAASPERDAVVDEHGALTYAELERRANQLAHRLVRAGVGPDVGVGLCTDRSVDMVVGLLGILKAGGAYVPLHYEHPPARLAHQLATAGARVIVTQEPLLARLPDVDEVICLDRDRTRLDGEEQTPPPVSVSSQSLVYVIFTSGSTGAPKGVGVSHGNLSNYATDIIHRLGADQEPMSFGVVTSISTDLCNTSVFGALCSGGTLVLVSPVAAADAGAFARQAQRTPIDVLKITPSHMGALTAGGDSDVLPRHCLVIGGERAPWDLVTRVRSLSDCRILNHYGPTEATVGCCTFEVAHDADRGAPATVPIGRPIAGTSCYVLDERRELVPIGAPGRLHIGGAGVARGYVGASELTDERFLSDPFASESGARMYDTGDLARWLPDGTLEFLGRLDEQVKIRGYRVEPAEVEAALRAHPDVRGAVVVTRPGPAGDMRLIAYCAAAQGAVRDEVMRHLEQWLPEFMLPTAIVTLDSLPVTASGKIDRLALPDPDETEQSSAYLAPRTPVEKALVEIWSHVLGVQQVGVEDDFFALGGHSLLATQVVAQVRSDFAVDLPLHSLFTYPTVASLANEVVRIMGDSEEDSASLMAELEGLSDEEAERLLAGESPDA